MSREIVDALDGTVWIIEGHPGDYRARLAGPPTVDAWARKCGASVLDRQGETTNRDPHTEWHRE